MVLITSDLVTPLTLCILTGLIVIVVDITTITKLRIYFIEPKIGKTLLHL